MRITDSQIHLFTGGEPPDRHWRAPYTIADSLRDMDEAGVQGSVNHPAIWDPNSNIYAGEAAAAHPDRFATLGWVPLEATPNEKGIDELMALPGMLGMRFILARPHLIPMLELGELDWVWSAANARELPLGLFIMPQQVPVVRDIATRFPKVRILIDHLGVPPTAKLPDAAMAAEALIALADLPNVAIKASATPSMATDDYPFVSTHDIIHRVFDAFGASRLFWGTDYTRMDISLRQCVEMFTENLDWLKGSELEAVMGGAVRDWIGWT